MQRKNPILALNPRQNTTALQKIGRSLKQLFYFGPSSTNGAAFNVNEAVAYYPDFSIATSVGYYANNDQVFSALNKVSETSAMIPFYAYQVKDEQKMRHYKNITNRHFYTTKGLFDIKLMQTKALSDLPETDKLARLLNQPNPYQSRTEFFQLAYLFYTIGECFIYKVRLNDGPNSGTVQQLWILPPQTIVIHVSRKFPQAVTGYDFWLNGVPVLENIPVTDMIHIKRPNPYSDSFRGLYIFQPANKLLTRMCAEDDISTAQIQNGGLPGVIFDENIPNDVQGQDTLDLKRKTFYQFVSERSNKGAAWMTGGKLGYIATGLKLADLELAELSQRDFDRFLNILKISNVLFNFTGASIQANIQEQVRQMYTNACLPMVYLFRDKLNAELVNDFGDQKQRFIDCDISEITELQSDMKEMADTLSSLPGGFSMNELRAMFKWDEDPDPLMNKKIIKQGYSFIDDMTPLPAVDPALTAQGY